MFTTIVYSAFSTQLQITGDAIVRSDNDIRITNVKVIEQTNKAYETYNNKYTKDTTSMFVTLPSNSSISYEVEIIDKSNVDYIIQSIEEVSNSNQNINIDIELNQYDLINANSTKRFNINFTNTTNEEQNSILVLRYTFLENKFIVSFDSGNLLYGLEENKEETEVYHIKYFINNGLITVTSLTNDGFGSTDGRIYLEQNKSYIFSCDTNGYWQRSESSDSVEAYLLLDNSTSHGNYVWMGSPNKYEFIAPKTGVYWLRLDVNQEGKTYTFSNISVLEKLSSREVKYKGIYGDLPNLVKNGYNLLGWNTKKDGSGKYITSTTQVEIIDNHTLYAIWEKNQ